MEDSNKQLISTGYMVLHPKQVHILKLFYILFSRDVEKINLVEFPAEGDKENLDRIWLIFISVLWQKSLQSVATLMKKFQSGLEFLLNLPSSNGSFGGLLLNFLSGKVETPKEASATFLSTVGNLDPRVELDKSITHEDSRYYPALAAMSSKISYENKAFVETTVRDRWKMEFVDHYFDYWNDYQEKHTTQGFILHDKTADPDMIVVAFRGTEPFDADAWCTDLDISWIKYSNVGKIHGGFMKALGLPRDCKDWPREYKVNPNHPLAYYAIREKLKEILAKNSRTRFIVTGHSLGGALAILFPAVLALHREDGLLKRLEGVYTFGQPRVGDEDFGKFMTEQLRKHGIRYLRFVYSNDLVPRLPADDSTFSFKHFGTCLYFNSCYVGKILDEEPNKNYFSPLAWIPKHLTAAWELARSFIIPYTSGPDYGEGFLLKCVRAFGLIFPGLAAHAPQDYVNATRLGSPHMYLQLQ